MIDFTRFGVRRLCLTAVCAGLVGWISPGSAQTGKPSDEWLKVVSAARKEGKVTFYNTPPIAVGQRIAAGFRKAYPGIEVELFHSPAGQLISRIEQERKTGSDGGDLFLASDVKWLDDRTKEGNLIKPTGPAMVRWPPNYVRNGHVVVVAVEPVVISYNKNLVSIPPKGFADLLAPEFKGRLGTSELVAPASVAWYDWLEKSQGNDYLLKLRAQNPKLYNGATPLGQALAAGEIAAVVIGGVPSAVKPLMDLGAPIGYVVPNPGTGIVYAAGAFGWSKRPNAAILMLDYIMSVEGQTDWHGRGETASPLPGIPGSLNASAIALWDIDAYPPEVVSKYRERWNKIFTRDR